MSDIYLVHVITIYVRDCIYGYGNKYLEFSKHLLQYIVLRLKEVNGYWVVAIC